MQLVVVLIMMYLGEWFLPEFADSKYIIKNGDYVGSGRLYHFNGDIDYENNFNDPDYGPSRHFTYILMFLCCFRLQTRLMLENLGTRLILLQGFKKTDFLLLYL